MKINDFLLKIKNWEDNFEIKKYDYERYRCELVDIYKSIFSLYNIDKTYAWWIQTLKGRYLELKHPIENQVKTRAVQNCISSNKGSFGNYIIFVDKDGNNPWILWQFNHTGMGFITEHGIFFPPEYFNVLWIANNMLNPLKSSIEIQDKFNIQYNAELVLCLGCSRPYHYFYDHLFWSFLFKEKKIVYHDRQFLLLDQQKQKLIFNSNAAMGIYPNLFHWDFTRKHIQKLNIFGEKILNNEIKHTKVNILDEDVEKYDLVLWIGLAGERRAWNQQVEGISNILFEINKYFDKIKVFVDGMTSLEGKKEFFKENLDLFLKIKNEIISMKLNISIVSLAGFTYREKIKICNSADLAISDIGTTSMVPFDFCKKPGVGYYGAKEMNTLVNFYKNELCCFKVVDECYVSIEEANKSFYENSFNIPWQHIYNLTTEVIWEIKNIVMHRLEIPSLNLILIQNKIQKDFGVRLSLNEIYVLEHTNNLFKKHFSEIKNQSQCRNGFNMPVRFIGFSAKSRIQNQLSYKLGQAMIANSKSLLGYIRMPFILSYIYNKHKQEQKIYQEKIKQNPSLKLPPLESYPDYKEALKEKECLTYKLGEALIQANKTWYKGGYVRLLLEIRKIKKEKR